MLGNCSACLKDDDCSNAPFFCAQKFLNECGANAHNTSVSSESFIARASSCAVSPSDTKAAFWNHPGYVLRGSYRTTTARSGIRYPAGCAEICGGLDECDAFIFIESERLCMFFVGYFEDICTAGMPGCVYTIEDLYGTVSKMDPNGRPLWVYDQGGIYCAHNAMECGCTREYFQCLQQNGCEGKDDDISVFADMCSSRGCTSDQCGLRWTKSSSFASACTNDFFDCLMASDGDCLCTSNFVDCMAADQDAVAIDMKTGLTLIDLCTLEGCTSEDCGLDQEYCNATSLKCATDHIACSGGAYDYISWDVVKSGTSGPGLKPYIDRGYISFPWLESKNLKVRVILGLVMIQNQMMRVFVRVLKVYGICLH
jgi:hypothetical protein